MARRISGGRGPRTSAPPRHPDASIAVQSADRPALSLPDRAGAAPARPRQPRAHLRSRHGQTAARDETVAVWFRLLESDPCHHEDRTRHRQTVTNSGAMRCTRHWPTPDQNQTVGSNSWRPKNAPSASLLYLHGCRCCNVNGQARAWLQSGLRPKRSAHVLPQPP